MLIDAVFSSCFVTEVFFEIFVSCAVITMSFGNQVICDKKQKFWHFNSFVCFAEDAGHLCLMWLLSNQRPRPVSGGFTFTTH